MQELDPHYGVIIEESAGIFSVGAYSSNDGGEVDNNVRFLVIEHAADGIEVPEVVFKQIGNEDILTASIFLKFLDEMGAEEAFSSGNGYSLGFQADH
jgi:hypothetical protein